MEFSIGLPSSGIRIRSGANGDARAGITDAARPAGRCSPKGRMTGWRGRANRSWEQELDPTRSQAACPANHSQKGRRFASKSVGRTDAHKMRKV